jgi:hypothetical protein
MHEEHELDPRGRPDTGADLSRRSFPAVGAAAAAAALSPAVPAQTAREQDYAVLLVIGVAVGSEA